LGGAGAERDVVEALDAVGHCVPPKLSV